MKFKGLDLNLVVALNALLNEKSVSGAGRKIALSQPATSAALSKLREHFKDDILVAHGRGMALTSFGASLIDPVRRLMVEIETTLGFGSSVDFDPRNSRRTFRINITDFVLEVVMAPLTQMVARAAPNVVLEFVRPANIAHALEEGAVDLIMGPEGFLSGRYHAAPLATEDYLVIGDAKNPALQSPLSTRRFFEMGHVSVRFGRNNQPTFAEMQINRQPHRRRVEVIAASFSAMPILVAGTSRIALMQRSLAKSYAKRFPLVLLDPPFEIEPVHILIQHHESAKEDGGIQWLLGLTRECVDAALDPSR